MTVEVSVGFWSQLNDSLGLVLPLGSQLKGRDSSGVFGSFFLLFFDELDLEDLPDLVEFDLKDLVDLMDWMHCQGCN